MHDEYVSYARYSVLPMMSDAVYASTRCYKKGVSISEKRSEIAAQLTRIGNAQRAVGVSTYSVDKLSAAFEKSYDKATAGYWRGGLRDPFWRCLTTPDSPGVFYSMVADQLNEPCAELLTPSARRFLKVLTSFGEALDAELHLLQRHDQLLAVNAQERGIGPLAGSDGDWEMLDRAKCRGMALRDETAPMVERMRRAVDKARSSVRPEKKHHGKREAINGGLYTGAAIIAGLALLVSGSIVAVVGFAVTMLIRCVSLGSIRGFDREKGWKAVEGLLDHVKEFINNEENTMNVALTGMITRAQADQDRLMWEQGKKTWEQGQRTWEQGQKTWEQGQKTWALAQETWAMARSMRDLVQAHHEQGRTTLESVSTLDAKVSNVERSLSAKVSNVERSLATLEARVSSDIKELRNAILFVETFRRAGQPDSGASSSAAGDAAGRAPMERATSLDTYKSARTDHSLMA